MDIEAVREYLADFQKKDLPRLVERELEISKSKKIKSIIGPRRAGKTFFLYQKMREILESGGKKEDVLYLNFEDPRLIDIDFKEIRNIVKLHWQLFRSQEKLKVFVDEPQNIKKWETAARALYDEGFDVFLSGSSSKLLSKEIATSLRGRTISYLLLPFSFQEFLKMKNFAVDASKYSSREKALLLNLLEEYLEFGGFPEVILEKEKENKERIISEYFNLVVYRDLVERYKIRNTQLIKWLIKSLITSFSKEFSIHKMYLTLKSKGIKLSKNTLYSYSSMLQDVVFVFFVPKFDYSVRKKELLVSKAYLCDVGFTKITETSKDRGKKMENVVFLELERRKKPLTETYYWKDIQGKEVDFVIKEGARVRQLIQVCCDINDYDTKKRETKTLVKASKELKCSNLLIITEDKEGKEKTGNKTIKYTPLWKWLLEKNQH